MTIKRIDAYLIVCDHESCHHETKDHNDNYAFWDDPSSAYDDAVDGEWIEEGDKIFCPCHWDLFKWCDECDQQRRSAKERDNGDVVCDECFAKQADGVS